MNLKIARILPLAALVIGAGLWLSLKRESPSTAGEAVALEEVHFNRDIRPILSETCFNCHGPDENTREADLRLDLAEGAFEVRENGFAAVVPGDPENSEVWQRIISDDPDELMPPPDSHYKLTAQQKETFRRWIEDGARYEEHWAFVPPEKAALPKVKGSDWARGAIDRFILARLEQEGLQPMPEADRRTLIRRLSYDLTGLPPSVEEARAFANDASPDVYERLVDRLLASPHYGERMAVAWLDQSRYADTNGYSRDGARTMWLWRDWVIQAYNEDKPFDAFMREQIAGDLLPNATPDQIVATGFSRNHMITAEGGTIPEENLNNYVVDRVKTTSEAFLGLTMGCVQCHDHKFDPISMRDYYRMYAYFNTLDDKGTDGAGGLNARPTLTVKTSLQHRDVEEIRSRIKVLEAERISRGKELQADWEQRERRKLAELGKGLKLYGLKPLMVNNPNIPPSMVDFHEDGSIFLHQKSIAPRGTFYSLALSLPESPEELLTGVRVVFYPHADVNEGALGYGAGKEKGSLGVSAVSISSGTVPVADFDLNGEIPVVGATASYSHKDYPATSVLDPRWPTAWSPLGRDREPQHLTLVFEKPVDPKKTPYFSIMINFQQIANAGHFKFWAMTGKDDGTNVPRRIQKALKTPSGQRSPGDAEAIAAYHLDHDPVLEALNRELAIHRKRLSEMTEAFSTQVMDSAKKPRKTFILERGAYDRPGEEVQAGVLEFLLPSPEDAPADRRALADWMADPKHPLTSRVAVNRIWQMLFGKGIVATSADFGSQGEWPSHPELLDYLAVDFIEKGWSVKALVKQIVTSAAYRQSSVLEGDGPSIDPDNRLLSRGPRSRLQAEFIRDGVLKASGLLNDWIGGSSVKPYQPRGIWREISHYGSVKDLTQVFVQSHGSELYRRSMYTLWKRTAPPPTMMAFDAPNRELCVMSRESTNTPLQALTLLNDPQFVEAGRVFAERMLKQMPEASDEERLSRLFETVTSRPPETSEVTELVEALEEQRRHFRESPSDAKRILSVGEARRDPQLDAAEHAALAVVANLVFNLSEAITKG